MLFLFHDGKKINVRMVHFFFSGVVPLSVQYFQLKLEMKNKTFVSHSTGLAHMLQYFIKSVLGM